MKAIILAAGRSRRLFPITHRKPKCLLKIGEETIIDRLVHTLRTCGVTEIVVVIGFRANLLETHLRTRHSGIQWTFVTNDLYGETLPAYGLWLARAHILDTTLYLNADLLCEPALIRSVIESDYPSVTAIQKNPWDSEEVNVVVDGTQRITEIGKHIAESNSDGEFMGVTKFNPTFSQKLVAALDAFVTAGDHQRFAADAINAAIHAGGELYALDVSQYKAHEIDTIEDYEHAKQLAL